MTWPFENDTSAITKKQVRKFLVRLKRIFGYGISKFGKNKFQHTPYI